MLHHGHFVLGQRAGLVGADDLRAAQGLHGGQAADDGVALGHIGHADGQHHRNHRRQALGNRGHRQRHGNHKGIDHRIQRKSARAQQLHAEDHHADAQHQPGQHPGELAELALQRGLAVLGLGQRVGDLAHLAVHAGGRDHRNAAAVSHAGTHVDHVLPVAQRHVLRLRGQVDRVDELRHRHRLARERRFLDLETGALDQPPVGRHRISRLQQHHVAHHQLLAAHDLHLAVAQHLGGRRRHLLQRLDGALGLVLLIHAQHGVDQHHGQDDDDVGEALALHHRQHAADQRRRQQDQDHRIRHLHEEALDEGILLRLGELVPAVGRKPLLRLRSGQALAATVGLFQRPFHVLAIEFHLTPPFLCIREKIEKKTHG